MELPHILAANFTLLLFLYTVLRITYRRFARQTKSRLPPEASGGLPVIGHLHKLSAIEPTHKTLAKMADVYGPIFTLRLGMNTALVVSSWEIARECFTTNDKIFASRPKSLASELLGYNYASMGISLYGPYWRHIRKIATLELLTNHRLEQFQHIRISEVQTSIKKLYELSGNNRSNNKGRTVEMKAWFEEVTTNTILRIVVGKRFSSAFEDSDRERYRVALRDLLYLFGAFVPSDSFPFLNWLDVGGYKKAMKKAAKVLDDVLDKWIEEHRAMKKKNEEERKEEDFMDVMLSTVENHGEYPGFDVDTVTKATCLTIILGGADTTMITMTWALSLLLNNQEALKKAKLELDEKVGRQRHVKESDITNLIYLQAIVKETLRLYPPVPLLVPHESTKDCVVCGYHVPARTRLMVNVQKLQQDPLVWEDPFEFRPKRFLMSHKDYDMRGQNFQLIPFGSGRRMCPGISFALQVMHLTLANLLHEFEISRPSEELLDMEESFGLTILRKTPLEVVLCPRLPTHVVSNV